MSSRGLVRSVYRALLAQTRAWPADGLIPKASIDVAAYRSLRPFDYLPLGSGALLLYVILSPQPGTQLCLPLGEATASEPLHCAELDAPPLASLVPEGLVFLPQIQAYGRLTAPAVRACIRANFREHVHAEPAQQGPLLDQARTCSDALWKSCLVMHWVLVARMSLALAYHAVAQHQLSVVQALSGLQAMTAQLHLERCSSDTITEGVRVSVTSALLEVKVAGLSRRVCSVAPS